MGSNWSSLEREPSPDLWWPAAQTQHNTFEHSVGEEKAAEVSTRGDRGRVREEELEIFKQELARKRALRHEALAALQAEMKQLREQLEEERNLRQTAEKERDYLRVFKGGDVDNSTGRGTEELQQALEKEREEREKLLEERERLREEVEEKHGLERQVQALKDVSEIGKEMLRIRELQVKELKKKLVEINISSVMAPPEDLRVEYETQIENIRKLRTLYEERAAATLLKHQQELEREEARITVLETKLSELQKETDEYKEAKKELEGKIELLESNIQHNEDELEETKDNLFSSTVQNKSLNSQMTLINNLFSHMLVSPSVDLDRLTRLLKENHGLITDLTEKGDSNEIAALLVDLAEQVEKEQTEQNEEQNLNDVDGNVESQSEVASNLSKVWRVMVELLSHHQNTSHSELAGGSESCYKCIQTPSGPRSVISVSQTFLTLKDLILEKNRLVKEVGRLKTLNSHLEHRLGSQEKRLSVVTTELRKTWGVVNKLRAQHKQLHTHEKILRYELQQKRCMLTELKQELEHCRDKWDRARQKNSQTEEDWKKLRKEFAARKSRKESNSAESGYEEEDVAHSPPSESVSHSGDLFEITPNEGSEPELSEEDIEHSDGNSFDTVIDLLDISCLENSSENDFVLCDVPPQSLEVSSALLPLSGSEFTEGLDQIESEDLAAVLDIQYQNQLLGADYNLSLPSSSGSSPIPTENDDFASSEMDISEEDSSSNDNHTNTSSLPNDYKPVPEDTLLFGSNSSKNISKFLEGLFIEHNQNGRISIDSQNLLLVAPSTSQAMDDSDTTTPLINNENCYQFPNDLATPLVNSEGCFDFPVSNDVKLTGEKNKLESLENVKHVKEWVVNEQSQSGEEVQVQGNCDTNLVEKAIALELGTIQEEMLNVREEKLNKMAQQCRSLVSKVTSTSFRNKILSDRIGELNLCYALSEEVSNTEEELATKENDEETKTYIQTCDIEQFETNPLSGVEVVFSKPVIHYENSNSNHAKNVSLVQSSQSTSSVQQRTQEEILEARAARLKRLEDQCKSLFSKMSATSSRSEMISNKLDELHVSFGTSEQTENTDHPTSKMSLPLNPVLNSEKLENTSEIKSTSLSREEIKGSRSPDLVSESKEILNKCSAPGPSVEPIAITPIDSKKERTPEEILEARAERFKRLEDQCKSLVSKMTATSLRSEIISNKLDELHSCYGSSEDASDNDEHSSSSREGDRRRPTPNSSPRYSRKIFRSTEKDKQAVTSEVQSSSMLSKENNERIDLPAATNTKLENTPCVQIDNTERAQRTPEEILQARAQRLNRLEEQCKSLFSKMSATSQRSDIISNRLEELHGQYGLTSTVEERINEKITPSTPLASTEVERFERESNKTNDDSKTIATLQSHKKENSDEETTAKKSNHNGGKGD